MTSILFTGGGSAGHVTPNVALIQQVLQRGWQPYYIGTVNGIERQLIAPLNIPYYAISAGKLRRQVSLKNLLTPFQVIRGCWQSWRVLGQLKPDIVFSKGGFVAFPVVFAAWCRRIPVVIHESDLTPGLANRLSFPFASRVCVTFPEGKQYFKKQNSVVVTGTPLRSELFSGQRQQGLDWCGFSDKKPVILVMGGGLGAQSINQTIRACLPALLNTFQIIHVCGPGKCDPQFDEQPGYRQVDYVHEEISDIFACSDLIISRAGANSLVEILALRKPHLLIPLSAKASRGDQIQNADYYHRLGLSEVLSDDLLDSASLIKCIDYLYQHRDTIQMKLAKAEILNGTEEIIKQLCIITEGCARLPVR